MTQVIRVSKEGKNVGTVSDPNDLSYASDYNTLKYYASGTTNVVPISGQAWGTVAHNLGYVPFFVAYASGLAPDTDAFSMCPQTLDAMIVYYHYDAFAGTSNLFFRVDTNDPFGTVTFRYFIFRNNLGL